MFFSIWDKKHEYSQASGRVLFVKGLIISFLHTLLGNSKILKWVPLSGYPSIGAEIDYKERLLTAQNVHKFSPLISMNIEERLISPVVAAL